MTAELPLLPAPPQPAGLLPAPAAPVALLPAPVEPVTRIAMRKRDGGDMMRAMLMNRGIPVSKIIKHQGANKQVFTAAMFGKYTQEEAEAVAKRFVQHLRALGFKVINWGVDICVSLMFAGTRTPMWSFTLSDVPTPTRVIEPWAKRAIGMPVLRIA